MQIVQQRGKNFNLYLGDWQVLRNTDFRTQGFFVLPYMLIATSRLSLCHGPKLGQGRASCTSIR